MDLIIPDLIKYLLGCAAGMLILITIVITTFLIWMEKENVWRAIKNMYRWIKTYRIQIWILK